MISFTRDAEGFLPPESTVTRTPERDDRAEIDADEEAARQAEELDDGRLDPDELNGEPHWWDEGSDDET